MDTWEGNGLKRVRVAPEKYLEPCLSDKEALHLSNLVCRAQEAVGYSPDVEWVCDDQEMYLVQCRPVTNGAPSDGVLRAKL